MRVTAAHFVSNVGSLVLFLVLFFPFLQFRCWSLDNAERPRRLPIVTFLCGCRGVDAPSWAKLWFCVLNLYEWEGLDPIIPELWSLPYWLPFHPGRYWCHCRVVYLPQSYLYGSKAKAKLDPLLEQLRGEIYVDRYEEIQWNKYRGCCCQRDQYFIRPRIQSWLWSILHVCVIASQFFLLLLRFLHCLLFSVG